MLKRKVSLEDFYAWYQENKIRLREDASKYSIYNEQLREEFLKEWPLDRILTMSIDEYVKGKELKAILFATVLRGENINPYLWELEAEVLLSVWLTIICTMNLKRT